MVYNISSSIQVQPISTIPIWGARASGMGVFLMLETWRVKIAQDTTVYK